MISLKVSPLSDSSPVAPLPAARARSSVTGVPPVTIEPETCTELALSAAVLLALTISSALLEATPLPDEEPPQPASTGSASSRVAPIDARGRVRTIGEPYIAPRPEALGLAIRGPLQDREVPVELPLGHLDPIVLPLLALDLDVAVEHVLAERAQHQLRLGCDLDRFAERLRQLLDAQTPPLLRREVVEVLLHRLRELVALLDALEAGLQQHRECEVGVARRVRAAQLHARRLLLAGVIQRHAHERRAVAPRPRRVHRRLKAGDQALVGVDPLGEDRADLP